MLQRMSPRNPRTTLAVAWLFLMLGGVGGVMVVMVGSFRGEARLRWLAAPLAGPGDDPLLS
jgi:hypothetical protein